jgi:hypothetical protein
MSYMPGVTRQTVRPFVNRFAILAVISALVLYFTLVFCLAAPWLWEGKRLFTFGTMLVFLSTIHRLYFDIKRKSAINNRYFAHDAFDGFKLALDLEKLFVHAWVLGFFLLLADRWL